tara:strand:+ start:3257 stop:4231 length:975 start_codon:yes stop_codon:yes gene_type:complete
MYPIKNLVRSVKRKKDDKLKIITFCETEEKYNSLLAQTGHDFYLWNEGIESKWNELVENRPSNIYKLPNVSKNIYENYFDLVICHNRIEQYNISSALSESLHLPIVVIDHCGEKVLKPSPIFSNVTTPDIKLLYKRDFVVNVCTHPKLVKEWPHENKGSIVINTAVDTEKFQPANVEKSFSIVLDNFIPAPVAQFLSPLNKYSIISTDREDKTNLYNQGSVFINTWKNINIKLLEAMSCGTVPICIETPEITHVVKNKETGFIVKDIEEMVSLIDKIQNKEINIEQMSKNAREYIIKNHHIDLFINKWDQVFQLASNSFYSRGM